MTANRWIIVFLVLLLLFTGAVGYYSFTLSRQVDSLDRRLASYEGDQASRFQSISDNIAALQASTESALSSLAGQAAASRADIDALKTGIAVVGANVSAVASQVAALDKRVAGAEASVAGISGSIIDPGGVYQKAVQATVRITNGSATAGSGFIYDGSGRVVTAYHVVNGLAPIYVMLYDGKVSRATLLGFCPFSDVAVLKLDIATTIVPLALADSGKVKIGQPVVAIGSPGFPDEPLGLTDTLTSGIVSQLNRYVSVNDNSYANLIQFDTPVNFGNSGGPLIDSDGKVVGVVNARIDPTLGDGVSYAISSNKVNRVADSIIAKGSFAYPWMGLGLVDLTPLNVTQKGLDSSNGALVNSAASGGPAATAGVQTGDIIISADGVAARNVADLTSYLGEFKSPGDTMLLEVIRGANRLKIPVIVGLRPAL
jgi:2-alkenal reductase